ncbi:hypothetical protein [Bacteroides sp. 224]|uniref:hypothetical protein n=1 Tax=Bacteroides sp. 224 TaxID=2302936 RepID=UPI0013D59D88|nr:hypothetical protein [Bacteroides sp. 224]NDV65541.1 hypothetical protein [Bacteroides sp. 224]
MKTKLLLLTVLSAGILLCMYSCNNKQQGTSTTPDSTTMMSNSTGPHDSKLITDQALNDAARFVAGLPVHNKNSKLYALTQTKEWKNHSRNMDQIWNSYQQSAPKVLSFAMNELNSINKESSAMFYPFGGPDFLFSNSFFPDVDTYFLIGLERTGHAIQVKHPSARTYRLYQDAVSDVLSLSFFRTRDMNIEEENDTIDGVIPVISMLMARTDKEIVSIKSCRISNKGELVSTHENGSPITENTGLVEIKFFKEGTRRLQTLYYYATDLSNEGLLKNKPLVTYINNLNRKTTVTFIKSASYLMHEGDFSDIRSLILDHSNTVVQDDSGIPLSFYSPDKWDITLYGTFYKPTTAYTKYAQPELRDAYQTGDPKPLNFRIGFARQSNLQIMERK